MAARRRWLRLLVACSFAGVMAIAPWTLPRASAANLIITVSSTADSGVGSLREAIAQVNAAGAGQHQIRFHSSLAGQSIDLASSLPTIQSHVIIDGGGAHNLVIDGQSAHRIFFVDSGNVTIKNLELANGMAQGGHGGTGYTGGGGGLGAGGAIFVNTGGNVVVDTVKFVNNQAIGGDGGDGDATLKGGGGGGGAGGLGGSTTNNGGGGGGGGLHGDGGGGDGAGGGGGGLRGAGGNSGGGGGGGGGAQGAGGDGFGSGGLTVGGGGGGTTTAAVGQSATLGSPAAGAGGGGNGAWFAQSPTAGSAGGGGGGGGNASGTTAHGAAGGEYGGGGGAGIDNDGVGGSGGRFGGGGGGGTAGGSGGDFGGGGGAAMDTGTGGTGGFGGGGGGGGYNNLVAGAGGQAGFGGGNGGGFGSSGGDGGNGAGGAIFVREGGSLTVKNSSFELGCACDGLGGLAGDSSGTDGNDGIGSGSGIFVHDNTTAVFDGPDDTIFDDEIAGPGDVLKKGTGALELNNLIELTGDFKIEEGRVAMNGLAFIDQMTIDPAGELGGSGLIMNYGEIVNHGRVAPGNSIGTLTVLGDFTFGAGGTFEVEVDPSTSDELLVGGIATLDGNLHVIALPGSYTVGTQYIVLQAGQLNGTFVSVTDNVLFYDFQVAYLPSDEVQLTIVPVSGSHFAATGLTRNQVAVGAYLDHNFGPSPLDALYLQLLNHPQLLPQALDQLSGELYGTTAALQVQQQTLLMQTLMNRLRGSANSGFASAPQFASTRRPSAHDAFEVRAQGGAASMWTGWALGYGLGGHAQSDANAAAANFGVGGTLVGVERPLDENSIAGVFAGYAGANVVGRGLNHGANIQNYQTGAYLRSDDGFDYYAAAVVGSIDDYDSQRTVAIGPVQETLTANYNGLQVSPYFERGRTFETSAATLQPFVAAQYIYVGQDAFTESGGVTALSVEDVDAHSLRSFLGARAQRVVVLPGGKSFSPEVRAAWLHEFLETSTVLSARIGALGGTSFAAYGADLGRDWALVGTGVQLPLAPSAQLFLAYDAQVNAHQAFHVGSGGVELAW